MSFPKKGKSFPRRDGYNDSGKDPPGAGFVDEIASALRRSQGDTRAGVKTVASWTGANEKTVKNWFSGKYGPSGEHLVDLIRNSDDMLRTLLVMAGREDLMVPIKLEAAERSITELLDVVRQLRSRYDD